MRNGLFIFFLVAFFLVQCKPENEVSNNSQALERTRKSVMDFGDKSAAYRHFPVEIAFFDPVTDGNNPQYAIQQRRNFIKQSGLPDESNIDEFKKTKSIDFAFGLYNDYIFKNSKSPYLKTFEQYGAWLILTRLDLLARNEMHNLAIIYQLLNRLAATKYEGFQLMSYGINHLYVNNYDKTKVKSLCHSVLDYEAEILSNRKIYEQSTVAANAPQKLPVEIIESLRKYNESKDENRTFALKQIKELLAQL